MLIVCITIIVHTIINTKYCSLKNKRANILPEITFHTGRSNNNIEYLRQNKKVLNSILLIESNLNAILRHINSYKTKPF